MIDDIPRDLVTMVDEAVRALPPTPAELRRITRAGDFRRRRRAALMIVAVAGVLAAASTVVPSWVDGRSMSPTSPRPSAPPRPGSPDLSGARAQRMLISSTAGYFSVPAGGGPFTRDDFDTATPPDAVVVFAEDTELRGDDVLVPFRFAGDALGLRLVPAPNGGVARLVGRVRTPGQGCAGATGLRLETFAADGTAGMSREVGSECHPADLIGVDYFRAFLRRGNAVMAHALADGSETKVVDVAIDLGFTAKPNGAGLMAELDHGHLLFSDVTSCERTPRIVVYDVPTARTTAVVPPTPCDTRSVVRLSPDGRLLAIAYGQGDHLMIDVIDVASGHVRHRAEVGAGARPVAIAWHSGKALRLAWYPTPASGKVLLEDVLRISVATIQ